MAWCKVCAKAGRTAELTKKARSVCAGSSKLQTGGMEWPLPVAIVPWIRPGTGTGPDLERVSWIENGMVAYLVAAAAPPPLLEISNSSFL